MPKVPMIREVYTEEEAKKKNITWYDWSCPGLKAGDYIRTSDGWIFPIRRVDELRNSKGKYNIVYYSPFGNCTENMKTFNVGARVAHYKAGHGPSMDGWDIKTRTKMSQREKDFGRLVLAGVHPYQAISQIFPGITKVKDQQFKARLLLRTRRMIKFMSDEDN